MRYLSIAIESLLCCFLDAGSVGERENLDGLLESPGVLDDSGETGCVFIVRLRYSVAQILLFVSLADCLADFFLLDKVKSCLAEYNCALSVPVERVECVM